MRLKYFLRGLGIGIVVTTIILAISHSANRKMSDSEVIERAKKLGMGYTAAVQESNAESTAETSDTETDSSVAETTETESTAATEPEGTQEPESSEAVTTEPETTSTREITTQESTQRETTTQETTTARATQESTTARATQETTTEAVTAQAETTQTASESSETEGSTATTYTLTITSGMSSNTVCDMLKRNGIIADSGDFDGFLVRNGYADRIRVGSFEVNSNMSYEELAAAFCSR